ncbi:MAG: hypothetical protein CM15mP23_20900 [Cryomorphaceae bacterium]|nr:MAG: hypothetical protein CM15mP23_20900 [Cryomorphaceae bacterium]
MGLTEMVIFDQIFRFMKIAVLGLGIWDEFILI